jgi:hypothetical protein
MMRHILFQSTFQLTLLLILLFAGPAFLNIRSGVYCSKFSIKSKTTKWDAYSLKKSPTGQVGCDDFKSTCPDLDIDCFERSRLVFPDFGSTDNGDKFSFSELNGFGGACTTCQTEDFTHNTIMFNTFVFCQIFNEYNAKSLDDHWDVYSDLLSNHVFLVVSALTVGLQFFLIFLAGEFLKIIPSYPEHLGIKIGLAALTLPLGVVMRWIPMKEDPNSFFDNARSLGSIKTVEK